MGQKEGLPKRLKNLKELEKYGLEVIDTDKRRLLKSNLRKFMDEDMLTMDMIATLLNQSKQSVSLMINNPSSISLITALKLSKIFDRPINDIFSISSDCWYITYPFDSDESYYLNMITLEIITEKQLIEKNLNNMYFSKKSKQEYTKLEYDTEYRRYVIGNKRELNEEIRREREYEFFKEYSLIYLPIGKKVDY